MGHPARLLATFLLAASVLIGGAALGQAPALQGEYKIGILEPLTGPLAFEGKRHLEGYQIMMDMINGHGGVILPRGSRATGA